MPKTQRLQLLLGGLVIVLGIYAAQNFGTLSGNLSQSQMAQVGAAGTITAASCSSTDVQNAINSASHGNTVVIPAGTCVWTTSVKIPGKAITVQGAGVGKTIIRNVQNPGATA